MGGGKGQGNGAGDNATGGGQATGNRPKGEEGDDPFRAENVKGRIDPKGRISVTTFRGLPKPGQVTAEFQESLERARDDAQAPLDSEEIPRRYRDGIREYFDNLGKPK